MSTDRPAESGVRLKVKVEGQNISVPRKIRRTASRKAPERRQRYFFISNEGQTGKREWIDGAAVKEEPRLVRQFVAKSEGAG